MSAERRGTRSLAQLVPHITRRALGRRGAAVAGLVSKWPDIVGPAIARASLPRKLIFPKGERSGGTLQIAVAGSLAVELQHLEPQVLERINGFLGYAAVKRLRLVQDMTVATGKAPAPEKGTDAADGSEDATLDGALDRLGKAVRRATAADATKKR
ncbi:MAG: DUF721 domain-containing protein [Alphaproteobacteria bacterium]|nr:DUF721 domain-containing protein [Alphaproteobacteria bacterium]